MFSYLQDIYKLIHLAPQYHEMVALWIQSESLGECIHKVQTHMKRVCMVLLLYVKLLRYRDTAW